MKKAEKKQLYDSQLLNDIHNNPTLPEDKFLLSLKLIDMIIEKSKDDHNIEAFIFADQCLQSVFIPELFNFILLQLKMGPQIPAIKIEEKQFGVSCLLYLTLSHDVELYQHLDKFRKVRNRIFHKVTTFKTELDIEKEAKEGLKLFYKIYDEITDRENGKKPIPVMALYTKGYNDRGRDIRKRLEESLR